MNRRSGLFLLLILIVVSGLAVLLLRYGWGTTQAGREDAPPGGEKKAVYTRIVSLAPSLTQNIYYLGAGEYLVGCTSYCENPPDGKKPVVASAIDVDLEKIVSLKPDLIILTPLTNQETIEFLRKMDVRIEIFPTAKNFSGICEQFLRLAGLTGRSEQAENLLKEVKARVADIQMEHRVAEGKRMFFQIGTNPVFTVLPNTFMDDYITMLGGKNIADGMKGGIISRETVVARNPDIIFVATMGSSGTEELGTWSGYHVMSAAQSEKIYLVDSDLACLPTPVTFLETLEIMVRYLENED
ncbi:MAG: ABC transporter substrate-binding protein [Bacteroidales bacterium]|nr:ABC transporter substrate-binding protein [Bacteroidales bacterium]